MTGSGLNYETVERALYTMFADPEDKLHLRQKGRGDLRCRGTVYRICFELQRTRRDQTP